MRLKGVLQFQFILPNNISFLRMHKPTKFGDDLGDIRYSFKHTNSTHLPSVGFEQGRTAHAFRNVFPIFYKNKYLGCYEISYTSESIQKNLTEINKIHSHFLVNKDIFNSNTWKRKYLILKYIKSIENSDYMFTIAKNTNHNRLKYSKENIIKPHLNDIKDKMEKSEKFAFYQEHHSKVTIVAFLPIRNIKNDKTAAYIVSYTNSPHILSLLTIYNLINIISFVILISLLYLTYKQLLSKRKLQVQTKEQIQLLSLFNKGNISLFKWKNNESWSVEYVSNNVNLLTGYTEQDFIQNSMAYASIIHKDDINRVSSEVSFALANDADTFTHKPYRIITKDSKIKWIHDITTIIKISLENLLTF